MSDTEIRAMRYTIEQLSEELHATEQYLRDVKKALDLAMDWLKQVATPEKCDDKLCCEFTKRKIAEIESITKGKEQQ